MLESRSEDGSIIRLVCLRVLGEPLALVARAVRDGGEATWRIYSFS